MTETAPPYRRCVGVALFNRAGLTFIGRRKPQKDGAAPAPGHEWQMPQGGIDKGEEPLAAALRELYEETNVRSATLIGEAPHWLSYDLPAESIGKRWQGRYRGQTQKWFAFRFDGDESEINILTPAGANKHAYSVSPAPVHPRSPTDVKLE